MVGPGRSGTSTVARILHENLGVRMGVEFPPPDEKNPDGFYECIEIKNMNRDFVRGKIVYEEWYKRAFRYIEEASKTGKPWGFKSIRLTTLFGLFLPLLDKPRIIRCNRKRSLVEASKIKNFGYSEDFAKLAVEQKNLALDRVLYEKDYLTIRFDESRKSDEEVQKAITDKWKIKI